MDISFGIGPLQVIHPAAIFSGQRIAVIGTVLTSHPYHVTYIAQIHGRRLSRVSRHHRRRSPMVRQTRRHAVDTVAAGRVTHQIDLVEIDILHHNRHTDNHLEECIDMRPQPHVPIVHRRTWNHIYTLGRPVQTFLVLPLLVVHLGRDVAAAVQRDVEAASR